MKDLLYSISTAGPAAQILLRSGDRAVTRTELLLAVEGLARRLRELDVHSIALYADNGIDWIQVDLACHASGVRIVPVPLFFSAAQVRHTIESSGVDALITDQKLPAAPGSAKQFSCGAMSLYLLENQQAALIPDGTQKITFTSGTTGAPKGVCLSADQQIAVAIALASRIGVNGPTHLCVLPLSTLLENLAGVYVPLLAGGTVIAPPLAEVGLAGSSSLDVPVLLDCITKHQPHSLILVPEILLAITVATECGWRPPSSLHFVAVGGATVAAELILRARKAGIPVYEGYGLSECASVVTLNLPDNDRLGTVGRPLPHVTIAIDNDEIVVSGSEFLGYVGQPDSWNAGPVRTGDIGHIDGDGFIHVSGRAKNQIITSYGRNLSPEWVASELTAGPLLQQVRVVGDARPFCVALVYSANPSTTDVEIASWIRNVNQRLPDYARIVDWRPLPEPMAGTATEEQYRDLIEQMYESRQEASNQ
jgi:long-subunit acyl-CoA synthetase (AMP-forming)